MDGVCGWIEDGGGEGEVKGSVAAVSGRLDMTKWIEHAL